MHSATGACVPLLTAAHSGGTPPHMIVFFAAGAPQQSTARLLTCWLPLMPATVANAQELKPPMQVPGRYDPETRRCVLDKPELKEQQVHWVDGDGDKTVSKAEFSRWFWRRQGRCPSNAEWGVFQRADTDQNGTIDLDEFEAFIRETFGAQAVPREHEQQKTLEDSLDEFSEVGAPLRARACSLVGTHVSHSARAQHG